MSGSTWRSVSGRGRVALEIAADEAVVGDAELQGRGTGVLDDGGAVLLGEGEDAEDPADAELAVAAVDRRAERADMRAGPGRARQQRQRGRRRARRLIGGVDRVAAAARWRRCSRSSGPVRRIEEPDVVLVPLDGDLAAEPAGRRRVVGAGDFDAAVEVHGAACRTGSSERARAAAASSCGRSSANMAATWRLVVPWMRVSAQRPSQRSR